MRCHIHETFLTSLKYLYVHVCNWIYFFFYRFRQIKQQYDLKVHEAELVQARLKQSTHHHQLEEVEALQKTVGKSSAVFI